MILGIGVDLVEVARIRALREKHGDDFGGRLFTDAEIAYCSGKAGADQSFAARFAAKEAVMKAFGTGWAEGVSFRSIEVIREGDGPPLIALHRAAAERAREMGVCKIHLSLSHTETLATAYVIFEQ